MRLNSLAAAIALGVSALGLAGCATSFPAQVSRYQAMPATQGQSFYVVPANGQQAAGLEFQHFAGMVAEAMKAQGYAQAATPQGATMLVNLAYGVDDGRLEYVRDSFNDPYTNPYVSPYYGSPYARSPWGRPYYSRWGYYGARSPFYYGWNDPWMMSSYSRPGYIRQTVYQSHVDLDIRRKADNAPLFEGHAKAKSGSDNLNTLVPNLVTAMFTNFPGRSGETVKIYVPTAKRAK